MASFPPTPPPFSYLSAAPPTPPASYSHPLPDSSISAQPTQIPSQPHARSSPAMLPSGSTPSVLVPGSSALASTSPMIQQAPAMAGPAPVVAPMPAGPNIASPMIGTTPLQRPIFVPSNAAGASSTPVAAVQMASAAGIMGAGVRPGLILATPAPNPVPPPPAQFTPVRPLPPPRPGFTYNPLPQPQMISTGMAPRLSTPLYSPLVRPPSFPLRPSILTPVPTVSTVPRPIGPVLRPASGILKYPPGVPVPELAKGIGQIGTPEKPQTTVYVGKIASTIEDDFLRSLLELCGSIKSWKRAHDPTTRAPKGFGFCEFETADGVLRALRLLNKFSLDGQELVLNVNQATREYLERFVQKKVEESNQKEAADVEEETAPGVEIVEPKKVALEAPKTGHLESEDVKEDNSKKFGIVTDADKEADEGARKQLSAMLEERAKNRPLPPPPPLPSVSDAPCKSNSMPETPAKSKDEESVMDATKGGKESLDGRNEDETTSVNRPGSEYEKPETSSSDRGRRLDRFRERDRERGSKREKERDFERYERDRERERVRREREREMRIRDAERLYEERERQWEEREREKERARQMDREKEKERERERRREVKNQEEESDDESWRKRRHRDPYDERRRRRQREREEDEADCMREEKEIADAKRRKLKEVIVEDNIRQQEAVQSMEVDEDTDMAIDHVEAAVVETEVALAKISKTSIEDERLQAEEAFGNGMVDNEDFGATAADGRQNRLPPKKLGFGLVGSSKRATVPSVFYEEDEEEAPAERRLVPIDYSADEIIAVSGAQASSAGNMANLVATAKSSKRLTIISSNSKEERREDPESDKGRKPSANDKDKFYKEKDGDGNRERDYRSTDDRAREKNHGKYRGSGVEEKDHRPKEVENRKLLDAKQLIDEIPKTKEELFGYMIDWTIYDEENLHERMRPWISKKITDFLGEEEDTLVDFILTNTRKHVTAEHMLDLLEPILDDEAEMFVLKMWRMLIFEIRKVETGLTSKLKTQGS